MFNKKLTIARFFTENAVPIVLLTILFSSVIYIYCLGNDLVFVSLSAFSLIYSIVVFAVFEFLGCLKKTWMRTAGILVFITFSILFGDSLIDIPSLSTMGQWFFEPRKFSEIYVGSIMAIIVIFGAVLGSALYYFTRVRFRSVFVFLICMCPFSLFAKSFTDIPVIFTILIITFFFLLLITGQTDTVKLSGKNAYAAIIGFIVTVSAGAAFFPKLESAPYREEFDSLITGINIAGISQMDYNSFTNSSSDTTITADDADKVLFRIMGDNPVYIKRQCFNRYNALDSVWGYYGDDDTGYNRYSKYIRWENPALIAQEFGVKLETKEYKSLIISEVGMIRAIYTPENMTSVNFMYSSLSDYALRYVYRTPFDEYFHSPKDDNKFDSYSISWYDFDIDQEFMSNITDERAAAGGWDYTADYYLTKTEMLECFEPLMSEEERRKNYLSENGFNSMRKLVSDVTAGCRSDYEKASAICGYLKSPQFIYDLDFVPSDSSVENFVFKTKRGVCGDYATAMTIMCREAGLYSRYVEGFLIQDYDEESNSYIVTAEDAHAYVQVWLDGYGWTDFDPTSPNTDGGYSDPTFLVFGIVMLSVAGIGLFIFIILPIIREKRFISKAGHLRGREQLIMLFPKMNMIIHKELGIKNGILTIDALKKAATEAFALDISETADDFEKTVYGDINCGDKNYIESYLSLKKSIKEKKRKK